MSAHAKEYAARSSAYDIPLDKINVSQPELFRTNSFWPYFERLRREDPVHYCAESDYGPFLVDHQTYNDIMAVDFGTIRCSRRNQASGGTTLPTSNPDFQLPMASSRWTRRGATCVLLGGGFHRWLPEGIWKSSKARSVRALQRCSMNCRSWRSLRLG